MKITQTVELNDNERIAIQRTLKIIDKISDATNKSMSDIFEYFADKAELSKDEWLIGGYHDITEM